MADKKRLTRQESKEQTRRDVLRAARRLFLRDGFVATSLAAIAHEAGVTKGAVYSNFESKEDLFLTIVRGDDSSTDTGLGITGVDLSLDPSAPDHGFGSLGRAMARTDPSVREVALFLEYNVFALRNTRSRSWVAGHNADYFRDLASRIQDVLDIDDEDIAAISQSLYVGLLLHRSFEPERFDADLFERAFAALGSLVEQD